jgi:Winged helix DNA-binding domain
MEVTARQLNRATLARQLLLGREPLDVVEAVRRVVALQAQEAASPYVALWNRLATFDPRDLDAAYAEHAVVKATLMRTTLHTVHADDYPTFRNAMLPALRAARLNDRRFAAIGLSVTDVDALVPQLVAFATRPRTNAEFETFVDDRIGVLSKPGAWWALRTFVPLVHAPTGGPWSFGIRPAYVAGRVPPSHEERTVSLQRLVHRCLEGFGPASVADIAQFTRLARSTVRDALRRLGDAVERLRGSNGVELFDLPGAPRPTDDVPAPPRLLAMWDSVLLAYAERSRVIPPDYRRLVIRQNGDVLPTLLVDGYVAGVWRPVDGGIEATAFHRLSRGTWRGLATEAGALLEFLAGRDPTVYRRYARWWTTLPAAEVRLLRR